VAEQHNSKVRVKLAKLQHKSTTCGKRVTHGGTAQLVVTLMESTADRERYRAKTAQVM